MKKYLVEVSFFWLDGVSKDLGSELEALILSVRCKQINIISNSYRLPIHIFSSLNFTATLKFRTKKKKNRKNSKPFRFLCKSLKITVTNAIYTYARTRTRTRTYINIYVCYSHSVQPPAKLAATQSSKQSTFLAHVYRSRLVSPQSIRRQHHIA